MKRSLIVVILIIAAAGAYAAAERASGAKTLDLLPKLEGWAFSEDPVLYGPESLFEYINGAAEAFIGYDLIDAAVGQYKQPTGTASLTAEVYDMGKPLNAFGIYTTERYPESRFLPLGVQGYIEEGTLNFLAGRYYVKLLVFGLDAETGQILREAGAKIARAIGPESGLPPLVRAFPAEGLVARSEKYIKKNFMGYEFLSNGYVATYRAGGKDLEGFIVDAGGAPQAEAALARLLAALTADKQVPEKAGAGVKVRNRYGQILFVGRVGGVLCGAMRVPDGSEAAGEKLFGALAAAAKALPSVR